MPAYKRKDMRIAKRILLAASLFAVPVGFTQNKLFEEGLKITFKNDSVHYIRASILSQFWARYNHNNPGSLLNGTEQEHVADFGIRRLRFSVQGQVTKSTFFYTQAGLNNLNSISARKSGLFIHDVTVDQQLYKNIIVIGGGLHGYNGTSRFSSSGVASILGMDLPVVMESTNDVTDQFGRKYGVYLKGEVSKLNYRMSISKPFPVQNSLNFIAPLSPTAINQAAFSTRAPQMNYAGYFFWQFMEKETTKTPYMSGSYLGKKRIINLGAGAQYQKNAMWYRSAGLDTVSVPLFQLGVDIFVDYALNPDKKNAVTAYAAYMNYQFGPDYIRNAGVFNVANGVGPNSTFNGAGNAFPLIGTGHVFYSQFAYKFKDQLLGKQGTLQPYFIHSHAKYQALASPVQVFNIGLNWLIAGQNSKLSLDYQSRPVFNQTATGILADPSLRRGQVVLQYQLSI